MLVKLLYTKIIILLISVGWIVGFSKREKWLYDLVNYIQHDLEVYQTIIINQGELAYTDSITNDIIIKITSSLPSKVINYNNVTSAKALDLVKSGVKYLRRTTLLITIQSLEYDLFYSQASDLIKILSHISGKKTKPKALAIVLSKEKLPSHARLLQGMWSRAFLDFTVLEIVMKKSNTDNRLGTHSQKLVSVHQYNPFTNVYTKKNYSSKVVIFPDKLQNLNGLEMKVSSFNNPPTLFVARNSSGFPITVTGSDALLSKTLSKVMNFQIIETSSDDEGWGHFDPSGNKTTGTTNKLATKKIQFSTNPGAYIPEAEDSFEFARIDDYFCYVPVVPITQKGTLIMEFSRKCVYLGLLISLLILLPIIVSYVLKFDKYCWLSLYVFEAALGFAIPREPRKIAERIVFIFTLFAFLISASAIYAVVTDFTLTMEVEEEINTLEDLRNTNLTLMAGTSTADIFKITAGDTILKSLVKTIHTVRKSRMCIDYLIKHRNVTCIQRDIRAQFYVNEVNKEKKVIKIAKLCLRSGMNCMVIQVGSPYLPRVDELLERLRQGGLVRKWYESESLKTSRNEQVESSIKLTQIMIPLVVVLLAGYLVSLLAFVFEQLLGAYMK